MANSTSRRPPEGYDQRRAESQPSKVSEKLQKKRRYAHLRKLRQRPAPTGNSSRLGNCIDAWFFGTLGSHERQEQLRQMAECDRQREGANFACCLSVYLYHKLGQGATLTDSERRHTLTEASEAFWAIYRYANIRMALPEFRKDLRRVLFEYGFRYAPELLVNAYEGGDRHCVVHVRTGDFLEMGMVISPNSVAIACATIQPPPVVVEIIGLQSTHGANTTDSYFNELRHIEKALIKCITARLGGEANVKIRLPTIESTADCDFYRIANAPLLVTTGGSFAIAAAIASTAREIRTPAAENMVSPHLGSLPVSEICPGWKTYDYKMFRCNKGARDSDHGVLVSVAQM